MHEKETELDLEGDPLSLIDTLKEHVISGDMIGASRATRDALQSGLNLHEIIDRGLIAAMDNVGEKFASGHLFVPEMMLSARTMQTSMNILRPAIVEQGIKPRGVVVFGTVQGDVHDIGKNLVIMMMQGAGFEVHDLGVNVAPEKFFEIIRLKRPGLCCMSALLSTTQVAMGKTIALLNERGLRSSIRVMVGGAVVTESFSSEIGADGYAPDAGSAVEKAKELLGSGN